MYTCAEHVGHADVMLMPDVFCGHSILFSEAESLTDSVSHLANLPWGWEVLSSCPALLGGLGCVWSLAPGTWASTVCQELQQRA